MPVKRVAVIGAGVSGLGAIKWCLEVGLEPTCFEGSNDIGGLWRYEEKSEAGRPSIYRSLTCNTSKEMTAYSDYPFPDNYPNYLHNSKMMEYLQTYAKHFGLLKYIHFLSKVCSVKKHSDFSSTGQWDVVVDIDGKQESYIFDGIMVCTGRYSYPNLPLKDFPGIKKFKGPYLHRWEYKNPEKFLGKRIVVIGIGNSAADIACELSHMAKQVFLSTRRGAWIWTRVWDNGKPMDTVLFTRFFAYMNKWLTASMINNWVENKLNSKFNHADFGLQPQHRFLTDLAIFGDDMPNHIISGRLLVKPNVTEFTEHTAIFEDGTEEEVDTVIFATGYTLDFPFLEDDLKNIDIHNSMYKFVFPTFLKKPTLAFIGFHKPVGAIIPTSEIQSRWVVRIFKGLNKLPSEKDMMAEIKQTGAKLDKLFLTKPWNASRVPYVDYMDAVASEIGVKPNVFSLFLRDPKLALEVFFGPCTPYQYRLQGPGKWTGARTAILTQRERIIKPMRTQVLKCNHPPSSNLSWLLGAFLSLAVFMFIFVMSR
ncbi:flavin-containing monooxygenase 5-like [Notamacropus eugenii]|uniref:flavin-containing monooxygenase 5-like n=1 Tax=Notamacropus eugenii TaxID=9315 RepID=UPI003B675033